jgi:preprotein translocase subunit SecA
MAGDRGVRQRIRRFLQRPGTVDLTPYRALLPAVGDREPALRDVADAELAAALRDDPVTVCAVAREAARRGLGERPFDVQLLGALAMLDGHVVEMATGEGKTLAAVVAAAGFVARGRSVQVLTVNDYLARRDARWMAPVYDLLGISVGWIDESSASAERSAAYRCQVVYGSVSEVGFDLLRDSVALDPADQVGAAPDVAVIDEADSVLIDEARVPLVLAGAVAAADSDVGRGIAGIMHGLSADEHYQTGTDGRTVHLTTSGTRIVEELLEIDNLYAEDQLPTLAAVNVALYAEALLRKDVDYIVRDGRVQLVSDSRGRVAERQRWPDGLQGAVEAKESLAASGTGEVLASITMQALVGRYPTVCGMTGTAVAVAEALREFYGLEVAVIPPNEPCVRVDHPDRLFPTKQERDDALIEAIIGAHASGQPVLVGTLDVAESERIARRLRRRGLRFAVLNAKNDEAEARIIAEAGSFGAITVSTQMAGRGTDIRLGGSAGDRERVAGLGGLSILASGRYWTSRLDNQLRGRAGRQGDPGDSMIFTSGADDLVVQYGSVSGVVGGSDVEHAQRVAEGVGLEIHRNTWRYNKLIEHQRRIVQEHRDRLLHDPEPEAAFVAESADRYAVLTGELDEDAVRRAARSILLYTVDRAWADHLAYLGDLREGIHLRALGRQDPLDEFHRAAIREFGSLLDGARDRAIELFDTAPVTDDGLDVAAVGVHRPTSTWTYLVHDNPAGTEIERALQAVSGMLRRKR